jgi:hypothetical protein
LILDNLRTSFNRLPCGEKVQFMVDENFNMLKKSYLKTCIREGRGEGDTEEKERMREREKAICWAPRVPPCRLEDPSRGSHDLAN